MAAHKTQRYLEKHKIGPLFESLMAQLIQDTPDDPVSYMIRTLQGMQKKHKIFEDLNGDNSFASNVSPQRSAKRSSLDGDVTPRHSNLAASWSVGERPKMPEQHRPRTSMKKTMESNTWSRGQIIQVSDSQPAWNNDTRVPTHDFDEWLHLQKDNDEKPSDKDIKEKYRGVKSWGAQESSVSKGKSDEKDSQFVGSDDLSNELNLGKYQKLSSDTTVNHSSVSPMSIPRSRPSKAKQAVEEHRQHLQDLLLNDNGYDTKKLGSGKYSPDEGMEILENIDELRQEGVSNGVVTKGAKLNKLKQKQEQVSVTICARCARIITGTEMNISSDLGSFLNGSNENRSLSAVDRVTWKEDIDDDSRDKFETASEASDILGTSRRKEWPIASDTESDITPRNNVTSSSRGKRYLENRSRREKSTSSPLPSSRPSSSRSRKSDISLTKHGVGKAWRPVNEFSSDNETEIESVLSHGSRSMNGQPWKIPSDNDSDNGSNPPHTGRSKGFSSKKPNKGRKSRSFISDTTSSIGGDTDF